jgi:Zn-dependent peptidase ImmA (M78 family)
MGDSSRKLTVEQVLEARLCYMVGEHEWAKLAKKFGVSREAIKAAAVGWTFKDLPMPPKRSRQPGR